MGYDIDRFEGEVDEELTCAICSGVLEDPIQAPDCEHAFCRACIMKRIKRKSTCPIDRWAITASQCRQVPRVLRKLLARLRIKCNHAPHGCSAVLKLNTLPSHLEKCEFNPKKPIPCGEGCGFIIPKDELEDHNCAQELRDLITEQQDLINEYEAELAEQRRVFTRQDQQLWRFDVRLRYMAAIFFLEIALLMIFL